MTGELVVPENVVRFGPFGNAGSVIYTPPRNTLDPRAYACSRHRVACDCREAEWAEYRSESREEHRTTKAAFDAALAGHPTQTWGERGLIGCQCTGCQIARAAEIFPTWQPL